MDDDLTDLTTKKREAFLARLRATCNVTAAARAAKVSRETLYTWRRTDPVFKAAWAAALEDALDTLEDIGRERAAHKSDVLLMFFLKAYRPERFRDLTHTDVSGALTIRVEYVDPDPATP